MLTFSDEVATTMCVQPSSAKSPPAAVASAVGRAPKQPVSASIEAVRSAAATAALRVRIRALGEANGRVVARSATGPVPCLQRRSRRDPLHTSGERTLAPARGRGVFGRSHAARSASRPTSAIAV